MKHIHLKDRKTELAKQIHTETQLYLEQEKTRSGLIEHLKYPDLSYTEVNMLSKQLHEISRDIKKQETKINGLQAEYDKL